MLASNGIYYELYICVYSIHNIDLQKYITTEYIVMVEIDCQSDCVEKCPEN